MERDSPTPLPATLGPLTTAWLALVALTLLGLTLGTWFHGAAWLHPAVALLIWLKSWLVARRFIETAHAHPFISRLVYTFITFAPLALIGLALFGEEFARWATL